MGLFTGDKLTAFTFSHSAQIDAIYTVYSATQIKAFFDSRGTDLQTKHNVLIDDLALVVSPSNGAIATVNSMANAGGDIAITGGTATTTTVTVANNTATKTIAITADVATTSINGISMIGNNTTLQAGPGTSALTMGILTDTAARTITFTVNGTALPVGHAITHAPGASDSIETYYFTISAAATLEAKVDAALAEVKSCLNVYYSNKDSLDIYTTIEWRRPDSTKYKKSVLSGGTTPCYTTRTVTYYDTDGTTVLATAVYTLTYSGYDLVSEVLS